MMSDKYQRDRT